MAHPGEEVAMRAGKATPVNIETSMCSGRFKALEFFPDPPDEMGLWPKGVQPTPAGGVGDLVGSTEIGCNLTNTASELSASYSLRWQPGLIRITIITNGSGKLLVLIQSAVVD